MQAPITILFSDSGQEKSQTLTDHLRNNAFHCIQFKSEKELLSLLGQSAIQLLLYDLTFFDKNIAITLLQRIQATFPELLIIAVVPQGAEDLIESIQQFDLFFYIHTPYDPAEIRIAFQRAQAKLNHHRAPAVRENQPQAASFHGLIGQSPGMRQLFELITMVAEDEFATVLIRGESGTGKELVAKAIHAHSRRSAKNFVPVNCAAIPDDLLESELFGYTKGAFTGALQNKIGRIEYANGGTLFLDEIGDMKPSLQAKLLRVLQEKEFEPVGGLKACPVDTRILAATHCDLEQLVKEGRFREDLYYRLSVIPLSIPPLKNRKEDIPLLLTAFIHSYATQRGRAPFTFEPHALMALMGYMWRGNVRELENLVQHMSILYSGKTVRLEDLPEKFTADFDPSMPVELPLPADLIEQTEPPSPTGSARPESIITTTADISWESGQVDFNELIDDFERQLIVQAMRITSGNKKEAAKLLNLKRTTLLEKMKKKEMQDL
jgi:DNA-binding NtrC family response regulator